MEETEDEDECPEVRYGFGVCMSCEERTTTAGGRIARAIALRRRSSSRSVVRAGAAASDDWGSGRPGGAKGGISQ